MKRVMGSVLLALVMIGGAGSAHAAVITFDFETATPTYADPPAGARPGALTSLALTNGGLTLTITRPGSAFDVVQNSGSQGSKPASWGLKSLDPFFDESSTFQFVADFSQPVSSFSFQFGDYGGDADNTIVVQAYAGPGGTGGTIGGPASTAYGQSAFPTFGTLAVTPFTTFSSVRFIGGSTAFPSSLFFDNLSVVTPDQAAVPEPASLLLIGTGLAGLARRRFGRGSRRIS